MRWTLRASLVALALFVWGGCTGEAKTSSPVPEQVTRGRPLYVTYCSECHGSQGEGGIGPALIGSDRVYRIFGDAQRLYDFIFYSMPVNEPQRVKPEDKWDILAFILYSNDESPKGIILGPETAPKIDLR